MLLPKISTISVILSMLTVDFECYFISLYVNMIVSQSDSYLFLRLNSLACVLKLITNIMNIHTSVDHSIIIWQNLNISDVIFILIIFINEQLRWTVEWFICESYFKCWIFYPNLTTHVTHNKSIWQIISIDVLWTNGFNKIAHTFDISINWKESIAPNINPIAILEVTLWFIYITIINFDFK
jgi:hypothetical protein